jgi:hypothetical protein
VKIRVRHVYDFGPEGDAVGSDLVTPTGWDAARDIPGPFGLPDTREEWERLGATTANEQRAGELLSVVRTVGATAVCSHGVGTGLLEQALLRLAPDLRLTCTDFAPRAAERLRSLFPEAEVIRHDLARDPLPQADLHVMHRLDQELSDEQWRRVFAELQVPVVFVPSEILDLKTALQAILRRLRNRNATAAGLFRNEAALRSLWSDRFTDGPLAIGGLRGFLLRPRR